MVSRRSHVCVARRRKRGGGEIIRRGGISYHLTCTSGKHVESQSTCIWIFLVNTSIEIEISIYRTREREREREIKQSICNCTLDIRQSWTFSCRGNVSFLFYQLPLQRLPLHYTVGITYHIHNSTRAVLKPYGTHSQACTYQNDRLCCHLHHFWSHHTCKVRAPLVHNRHYSCKTRKLSFLEECLDRATQSSRVSKHDRSNYITTYLGDGGVPSICSASHEPNSSSAGAVTLTLDAAIFL